MANINIEDTKYNNGMPIDTDDLSKDEWRQCAKEWSEGDKNLEGLIYFCLQKGLKTVASCSGHNGKSRPYISFLNNEKNKYIIDSIAAEFRDIKGSGIAFISGSQGVDGKIVNPFTTIYLPIRDTSGFCGIKRICKEVLDGQKYEVDNNLVLFREIAERLEVARFGSYIQYECGMPINHYLKNFKKNPFKNKIGKHIFMYTVNSMFSKILKKSQLITNGDIDRLYYIEQTEENKEQISTFFTEILDKLGSKRYEITNEELEQIARRPKNISVHYFFQKLTKKVKTFFEGDKTKEQPKKELGE